MPKTKNSYIKWIKSNKRWYIIIPKINMWMNKIKWVKLYNKVINVNLTPKQTIMFYKMMNNKLQDFFSKFNFIIIVCHNKMKFYKIELFN